MVQRLPSPSKEAAQFAVARICELGLNARLQTLKHPGMEWREDEDAIRGYSVSVKMDKSQIPMSRGYGYRAAPEYPAGFSWFMSEGGMYNLTSFPGDSLEVFEKKIASLVLVEGKAPH